MTAAARVKLFLKAYPDYAGTAQPAGGPILLASDLIELLRENEVMRADLVTATSALHEASATLKQLTDALALANATMREGVRRN